MPDDPWSWDVPKRAQASDDESPNRFRGAWHRPKRAAHADRDASADGFGRAVGFTVAGALLPGLGLIAANRRKVGAVVLGVFVLLIVSIGLWAAIDLQSLVAAAVSPTLLTVITIGLVLLALIWVGVIVATNLSLSRGPLSRAQRVISSVLVAALAFVVAAPMAVAARYSYDQAGLVSTVFRGQDDSNSATRPTAQPTHRKDPWKDKPRVNVLLLGGDAGKDRVGTRTDTVMVASIDTKTGDTTLISLPRNTAQMPFPEGSPLHEHYPYGFGDGNGQNPEYFLNAMYPNVPNQVPEDVLGKTDDLGADAMKLSVGEATGLSIDYYVLINLAGFRQLVDALGGITVNINTYVAIGGSTDEGIAPKDWLEPGPEQHLDGAKALWFARGRYGADDFQRMDRQRCVVNAIIDQANPATVMTRYEAIVKAGKDIVRTDIPQEALPAFVNLSTRVKDGNVRSLVFKNGVKGFASAAPDYDLMRERVDKALGETKDEPKKSDSGKSDKKSGDPKSADPSASASSSAESESAQDACSWQPDVAAKAERPS